MRYGQLLTDFTEDQVKDILENVKKNFSDKVSVNKEGHYKVVGNYGVYDPDEFTGTQWTCRSELGDFLSYLVPNTWVEYTEHSDYDDTREIDMMVGLVTDFSRMKGDETKNQFMERIDKSFLPIFGDLLDCGTIDFTRY